MFWIFMIQYAYFWQFLSYIYEQYCFSDWGKGTTNKALPPCTPVDLSYPSEQVSFSATFHLLVSHASLCILVVVTTVNEMLEWISHMLKFWYTWNKVDGIACHPNMSASKKLVNTRSKMATLEKLPPCCISLLTALSISPVE